MIIKNKYVVGVHVMFYEIEMVKEYIDSCLQMCECVDNKKNIVFDFVWNVSEYMEKVDGSTGDLTIKFKNQLKRLEDHDLCVEYRIKTNEEHIYNNPSYRRDLNYNYCDKVDFVLWGETDSLWPKETFQSIESVSEYARQQDIHRYILTFAYRKMWDDGWEPLEHVDMTDLPFVDGEEWNLNAPESPKSYMTLETMNEINERADELDIRIIKYPKFDGSCLVISSQLIKAGVNIPHAMLMCGEDTSLGEMAKLIMGDKYTQFIVKNIFFNYK